MLNLQLRNNYKLRIFSRCFHSTSPFKKNYPKKVMYYEDPNNKLNPHTYFYRVLAVPFLKFCGIMMITYYGMNGIWHLLEEDELKEKNLT